MVRDALLLGTKKGLDRIQIEAVAKWIHTVYDNGAGDS